MDSEYSKTIAVEEPDSGISRVDDRREKELAEAAVSQIKEVEKISGFGRFVARVQRLFQHPKSTKAGSKHQWRAMPAVLGLAMMLLAVLSILFVVSEPEGERAKRSSRGNSLVGPQDSEAPVVEPLTLPRVTEAQLLGGDTEAISRQAERKSVPQAASAHTRGSISPPSAKYESLGHPLFATQDEPGYSQGTTVTVFTAPPTRQPTADINTPRKALPTGGMQLPSATEILAHTINAINSGLESPVVAVVDQDVKLNGHVVIPQGARAIGFAAGAVKNRVNIRFSALVLPDGREIEFSGLALMKDGSAGLVGKSQGSGHTILAGAGRVATGAAVFAAQFAGRPSGSLRSPFSQTDLLRNQLAGEIAHEGNRLSNRLEGPMTVPIVSVPTNQRVRIFLLAPIRLENGQIQPLVEPGRAGNIAESANDPRAPSLESLTATQAAYIEALEAQLTELRAKLAKIQANGNSGEVGP